jgi:hypothetical protein
MGLLLFVPLAITFSLPPAPTPESRALAYLAREVPRWSPENKCYSCHNNGDAARALYRASRLSYPLPAEVLADTSRWLAQPQRWDHNGGEGPFSDKKLARIQFAAALVEALDAGQVKEKQPLVRAAELVAEHQHADGSWQVEAEGNTGSPATYGACLATHLARRTLQRADPERFGKEIAKADRWLRQVPVKSVLDAAAVVIALAGNDDAAALALRERALALFGKGQSEDGGWGPFVNAPPEPFDTALVLLALSGLDGAAEAKAMSQRGRGYLIATQQADGSWLETTRPAGRESYAQRLSTAGWATLALLATRDLPPSGEQPGLRKPESAR